MDPVKSYLPYISVGVGAWAVINGVLHNIFVLRSEHGKQYDRTLLRLLMDGHILITCGLVQALCFKGLQNKDGWAYAMDITVTISLLAYCAMIFPFLKSILTSLINTILLVILIMAVFFITTGN